ncbi:DUF4265 domain-containing protein [Frigoribacterium sp. 2-23]|uniref:DUF4265 domain-containing protein n=1 Tax=Frigoribacterium sp. 2-23 TaxID=3415006 RepID=UPI003C702CF7
MINDREWVKHPEPVWRERSNYIANFDLDPSQYPFKWEQLWLRKLSDTDFENCCIPFFAFGLHLGDIVTLTQDGIVESIVSPSGHWTLRLLFRQHFAHHDEVLRELESTGVQHERFSKSLYSLDTTSDDHAREVMSFLDSLKARDQIEYQTGWV